MCFTSKLSSSGRCAASAVSGLTVTAEAPRIQSMARRQIRGPVHRPLPGEEEQPMLDDGGGK
jgi:hypothetical protein